MDNYDVEIGNYFNTSNVINQLILINLYIQMLIYFNTSNVINQLT